MHAAIRLDNCKRVQCVSHSPPRQQPLSQPQRAVTAVGGIDEEVKDLWWALQLDLDRVSGARETIPPEHIADRLLAHLLPLSQDCKTKATRQRTAESADPLVFASKFEIQISHPPVVPAAFLLDVKAFWQEAQIGGLCVLLRLCVHRGCSKAELGQEIESLLPVVLGIYRG